MQRLIKQEYINSLLSNNKVKFDDLNTFLKESEQQKILNSPYDILNKIKNNSDFGNFLFNVYYQLRDYEYPVELKIILSTIWEEFPMSRTYIVGGAIRDIILGLQPKDYDIVTDIPYEILKELFNKFKIKEVGKQFNVLIVKVDNMSFEIANFRKDVYSEYGKGATSVEIGTIEDDIKRRDFDVNDLYYNLFFEELIDGNQTGLKSLWKKEFNFVGNGNERIKEDVLRLLRIGKLTHKGLKPSKNVKKIFRNNLHLLCKYGNIERIREHLETLLKI
jgi:tRNA nucleotidyltransferase/poly(A) polymerase